jgi:amino acid adenylation domain-containing protein
LPLDANYPKERLSVMLEDAGAEVLITEQHLTEHLPHHTAELVLLDTDRQAIARAPVHNPACVTLADNLVYVIYTSGSTGRPKATMIEHRSLANLAAAFHEAIYAHRGAGLRVSMNAPLSFDASVKQWMQLLYGHTLCILPEEIRLEAKELSGYIAGQMVEVLDITPSQLKALLGAGFLEDLAITPEVVLIGGEAIDDSMWRMLAQNNLIDFYNLYGPTECTDDTTYFLLRESLTRATIGTQIANIKMYILDRQLNPLPVGVAGEMYIGGAGVGRGYLKRPEQTAERFIPDRFSEEGGKRLYRTGDLVRHMSDGKVEYIGRVDNQVKVRGYRIELGEIEEVIRRGEGVKEAVVVAREEEEGDKRLVAYIVADQYSAPPSASELREYLEDKLPDYMIPSAFVALESLPLTPNKKLDVRALPSPEHSRAVLKEAYAAPRNSTEEKLTEIWAEVLRVDHIGVHDDFFKLGGHSLLAIQMFAKVRRMFGVDLLLSSFLNRPTIAGLTSLLNEKQKGEPDFTILVPIRASGTREPLFCIHASGGQVMPYYALAASLDSNRPVYGLQSRALAGPHLEHESIERMAAEYADAIRRKQPEGPYHLMGWSMGGVIAVSVAGELERSGQKVAFVGLIDSYLFTDDPHTIESDPLLGLGLAFGPSLGPAFIALSSEQRQSLRAELLALAPDERLQRIIHWGQKRGGLPSELSLEIVKSQVTLAEIHDRLLRSHEAPVVQAPLHVWWASERMNTELSRTDWSKYTRAAALSEIADGNHYSMLQPPQCHNLARRLEECLTAAMHS